MVLVLMKYGHAAALFRLSQGVIDTPTPNNALAFESLGSRVFVEHVRHLERTLMTGRSVSDQDLTALLLPVHRLK